MFKVLIAKKTRIEHDIKTVVKRAREYDDREESDTLAIPSSGEAFSYSGADEDSCGGRTFDIIGFEIGPFKIHVSGK